MTRSSAPNPPHTSTPALDHAECVKCGYSLRGLRVGGVCPECGTRIPPPKSRSLAHDNLSDAPLPYLKVLSVACWMLAASAVLGVGTAITASGSGSMVAVGILAALAVVWWSAVFVVTQPRRTLAVPKEELAGERRKLRRWARVTQVGWIAAGGCWAAATIGAQRAITTAVTNGTAVVEPSWVGQTRGLAVAAYAVALVGLVCLAIWLSDLAEWAAHTSLADRFRSAGWGLAVAMIGVPVGLGLQRIAPAGQSVISLAAWPLMIVGGVSFLAFGGLYVASLIQLAGMTTWAIANHISGTDRDIRVADLKARHADEMVTRSLQAGATSATPVVDQPPAPEFFAPVPAKLASDEVYIERRDGVQPYGVEPGAPDDKPA